MQINLCVTIFRNDSVLHWRCRKFEHLRLLQQDHGEVAGERVQAGVQGAAGVHLLLFRDQHDLQDDHCAEE